MQPEASGSQLEQAAAANDQQSNRDQGKQRVEDDQLRHRVGRAQPLDQCIHHAEQPKSEGA
jgi:hypothetical protein